MRALERELLEAHHWHGPAPAGFRHTHPDDPGTPGVIAASSPPPTHAMLVAIFVLLLILAMLAVAEMGLSRISPTPGRRCSRDGAAKSAHGADAAGRQARSVWVNSLLLTVNICQTLQATLTGIVAGSLFGPAGVVDRRDPQRHRVLRARRVGAEDLRGDLAGEGRAARGPPGRRRSSGSSRCG